MLLTKGMIGRKLGMTQIFEENGAVVPVTVIECGPCYVVDKKTQEKHGYNAIQLGFCFAKKHISKPLGGVFKKANIEPLKYLKEFRLVDVSEYVVGQELRVSIFQKGDKVHVTGVSKGKGFSGVVKRWGFKGGRQTHGSRFHRAPGSIGASADPAHVWKGQKLPGRAGNAKVTVRNLSVVRVIESENLLLLKGAVPGAVNGIVYLKG